MERTKNQSSFRVKMTTKLNGRVTLAFLVFISCYAQEYKVPSVHIQALNPKGFRAWIEDDPNASIGLFTFQGNINRVIANQDVGQITGEVLKATNGKWLFEDHEVQLKVGDIINYYVFVAVSSKGYIADNLSYTVNELVDASSSLSPSTGPSKPANCLPTATLVRGGTACAGQTIFEDNFETLREDYWQIEQYIPVQHPEYPFVTYQRLPDDSTVSVASSTLRIAPKLQENVRGFNNETIYSGSLNLFSGCTAAAEACLFQASGADIIPPIVSGRLTSKSFAFTYGTVHVRAKFPQGDWLYPDILLEPFMKKYGSNGYASGLLRIAGARGNRRLISGSTDYSNKVMYGGPIMDYQCRDTFIKSRARGDGTLWGDDYHIYSVRWAPDRITLSVDGTEWSRVEPAASGLAGRIPNTCRELPKTLLAMGSKMAPFDDHFTLTLGLGAGSVTEFPDGTISGSNPKPWSNNGRKAILHFWQDMAAWTSTWNNPQLLIDYVKVVAL